MSTNWTRHCLSTFGFSALIIFAFFGCKRVPSTVDEVIERNTIAMGGRAAIEAVNSIEFDLHIVNSGFEVDGNYHAARPGRMRIDVMAAGKKVYIEAFNGERGWQWQGKGDPIDESPQGTATLRHGVQLPGKLFGLHELRQRGHRIDLVGRQKLDGVNYFLLRITLSDGYTTLLFVDPKTWLVTRRQDFRPLHPDRDPTPTTIETRYSDFRDVSGVLLPFVSTDFDLKTNKVLERTTVRDIRVNPVFSHTIFDQL